ncbi:hypothetical protein ABEB36_001057 [Hypothenemus hampei]|uniref:C2H2-type domain-containing protein n=1 Tax=Hypothenemus hampei TaxID=57062 RepID=A0ABD1FGM1_HYPHA
MFKKENGFGVRSRGIHRCDSCTKSYKNKSTLYRHKKHECNQNPYQCFYCGKFYRQKYDLKLHVYKKHPEDAVEFSKLYKDLHHFKQPFICKNCYKTYAKKSTMVRHMRYECGKLPRFGCSMCGYRDCRKFVCSKCFKRYRHNKSLRRHHKFECGKQPLFHCNHEGCSYETKMKFNLKHHGRNFVCPNCFKGYRHQQSLHRHRKFECGKQPLFHCNFEGCTFRTKVKCNLKQHIQFVCNFCEKTYQSFGSLQRHMKFECNGNQKFKCPLQDCKYKSKAASILLKHVSAMHPDYKDFAMFQNQFS